MSEADIKSSLRIVVRAGDLIVAESRDAKIWTQMFPAAARAGYPTEHPLVRVRLRVELYADDILIADCNSFSYWQKVLWSITHGTYEPEPEPV